MKAVIPVAGLGTRMLPASKSIPKELLPLGDRPIIDCVVEECYRSGITDVVMVNHSLKNAIEDYFDVQCELEFNLKEKNKTELLKSINPDHVKQTNIISIRQGKPLGLGHAVLCARPVIGDEAFCVLLPDILIRMRPGQLKTDLKQMIDRFETTGYSQIMVDPVAKEEVDKYGVVDIGGGELAAGESAPVFRMLEKPPVNEAPSNLAITGRYVLSGAIWKLLEKTGKGAGGEIQLTDAINSLLEIEPVQAYHIAGRNYDCGSKIGYFKAFARIACEHKECGHDFRRFITEELSTD